MPIGDYNGNHEKQLVGTDRFIGGQMIVYSGKGYLVLLYFISGMVLTEIPCRGVFKDDKCFQSHPWMIFLGFLLGGLMCYATHLILGKIQGINSDGTTQEH